MLFVNVNNLDRNAFYRSLADLHCVSRKSGPNGTTVKYHVIYWISNKFRQIFLIHTGTPNRYILWSLLSFRRPHTLSTLSFLFHFSFHLSKFHDLHAHICICSSVW